MTVIEFFKLLPKTNCKICNKKTCLCFASSIFFWKKKLDKCPSITPNILKKYKNYVNPINFTETNQIKTIEKLKNKIIKLNYIATAKKNWRNNQKRKINY